MKRSVVIALCVAAVVLPYVGMFLMKNWYETKMEDFKRAAYAIVDKGTMSLTVYGLDGETIASFPIGCGKNYGNKVESGDNRTPEGIFRICDVQSSIDWKHDFQDGKGEVRGAYGPWFLRLSTGSHKGIGIHGTHMPQSVGSRCTEGCIRLRNEDIQRLKEIAYCGMNVIILPSEQDILENGKCSSHNDHDKSK